MYGLQFLAQFVFILEKLVGFGAKKTKAVKGSNEPVVDNIEVTSAENKVSEIIFQ